MGTTTSIDLIKKHEGRRLKLYKCTGDKWSIGWGRNLEDNGISAETAEQMLAEDMVAVRADCVKFPWFKTLNTPRQAVIENMIFNMGLPTFLEFRKTIALIEAGSYTEAANEMLRSKWARQVGNRAHELSLIMETGEFPEQER